MPGVPGVLGGVSGEGGRVEEVMGVGEAGGREGRGQGYVRVGEDRGRGHHTKVSASNALLCVGPSSAFQSPPTVEKGEASASVVVAGGNGPFI